MTLIIGKVDRKKRLQSVYSDGMVCSGDEIWHGGMVKCFQFANCECCVSGGFCGFAYLGQWFSQNVEAEFRKCFKGKDVGIKKFEVGMADMFNSMADKFYEKYGVKKNDAEKNGRMVVLVIINGEIYEVERFENERFHCYHMSGCDFDAVGQASVSAKCMLENGIKVQRIYDTVSKYNSKVNNVVAKIENVKY